MVELLVIHGAYIWPVFLVIAAVFGAFLPGILLRRRVRQAAIDHLQTHEKAAEPAFEEDENVSLRGVIEVVGPGIERFEDGAEVAASTVVMHDSSEPTARFASQHADRLELVIDDERVSIDAPIQILSGSVETHPGRKIKGLDSKTVARVRDVFTETIPSSQIPVFRSISSGDRIVVRGVLRRSEKESGTVGYREDATKWSLSASDESLGRDGSDEEETKRGDPTVPLVFDGVPQARGPAWPGVLRGLIVSTIIMLGLMYLAGYSLVEASRRPSTYGVMAAATPFHRCRGLNRLDTRHMAKILDEGLAEEIVDCRIFDGDRLTWRTFEQGRPSLSSVLLQREEQLDPQRLHYDHVYNFHVWIHLMAGDFDAAAAVPLVEYPSEDEIHQQWMERRRCVRKALLARRGDSGALEDLRDAASKAQGRGACSLFLADLLEGRARLEQLETCGQDCSRWDNRGDLLWLLRFEAAECGASHESELCTQLMREGVPLRFLESPGEFVLSEPTLPGSRVPSLELLALDRLSTVDDSSEDAEVPPELYFARAQLAEALATFSMVSGAPDDARRYLERAVSDHDALVQGLAATLDAPEDSPQGWIPRRWIGHDSEEGPRNQRDRYIAFGAALEIREGRFAEARAHFEALSEQGRERYRSMETRLAIVDPSGPLPPDADEVINEHVLEEYWPVDAITGARELDGERFARGYDWIMTPTNLVSLIGRRLNEQGQAAVRQRYGINDGQQHAMFNMGLLASNVPALRAIGDDARAEQVERWLASYRRALLQRDIAVFMAVLR